MKFNGQISILAAIGVGASILIATISGYISQNYRTDNKIQNVQTQTAQISERTAKLETSIITTQEDIKEIKNDIKLLIKIVK